MISSSYLPKELELDVTGGLVIKFRVSHSGVTSHAGIKIGLYDAVLVK